MGPCPDSEADHVERRVKVGFHRQVSGFLVKFQESDCFNFQGDIMDNKEFKLPDLNEEKKQMLLLHSPYTTETRRRESQSK